MSKYSDIIKKKPVEPEAKSPVVLVIQDDELPVSTKPKKRKSHHSFDTWEYIFFEHLLNLRNIFNSKIGFLFPEWQEYLMSEKFFYKFNRMLYDNSSTHFPVAPEPMSKTIENVYREYLIKRNDL
jgi:hypothetical protein